MLDSTALIIPSFIAGLLTFLAPCTLPLLPGYLGFISGTSVDELKDPARAATARRRIVLNGLFYVLGFSAVFILLGSLFGLGGAALVQYRLWLGRIGGLFVIFFGLAMMGVLRARIFTFLYREQKVHLPRGLRPGTSGSSFLFGATFAFGWSPCIGPILASVLFLASSSATVLSGALLLAIFSLGLAVPFLIIAFLIGSVAPRLRRLGRTLRIISVAGGAFLVFLGFLLITDMFNVWLAAAYRFFSFLNYDALLNYL